MTAIKKSFFNNNNTLYIYTTKILQKLRVVDEAYLGDHFLDFLPNFKVFLSFLRMVTFKAILIGS